jgi:hypothetical protein
MSWWRARWPDGRACRTTTSPTFTSGATRAAPTSGNSAKRSRAPGFRGSYRTVCAYLRPFTGKAAPPAVPAPPKVRHITRWIRRRPGNLDAGEQLKLTENRAACPHLDALRGHVEEFAKMITGLHGDRLDSWIAAVVTTPPS